MNVPSMIPTAEPFYLPGGSTGCLLIHGFTGTPKEMRWMGDHLNKQGHTVLGVRLAGHATRPEDMTRTRWQDWLASVEDGWNLLSDSTDQIFVAGLSMGGVLTLLLSAHYPAAGIVVMATPHHLPNDPRLKFIKLISLFKPFMSKEDKEWYDPEAAKVHTCYQVDPTRSYAELKTLLEEMRTALPKISAPALLIYSKDDETVKADDGHMEAIQAKLGSREVETLWIENSTHVITRDAQRAQVFSAATDFIARVIEERS